MNKFNDILSEIVHVATQAILCGDESVARVALGDIYHAIACVLPVDHRGADEDEDDLAQRLENA